METINLLAGGPKSEWPENLKNNQIPGKFIGIDRGSLWLIEQGIKPVAAVGDFDSVSESEFLKIKEQSADIYQSNPIKDETDTELAVKYAKQHFPNAKINIYGFSGSRLDQLLTNLLMVYKKDIRPIASKITLIDRNNVVNFFSPGTYTIDKIKGMKYLDFVPLEKTHLTLYDERYRLDNKLVQFPTSFSSNEFIGEQGTFTFDKGMLIVIQSKD